MRRCLDPRRIGSSSGICSSLLDPGKAVAIQNHWRTGREWDVGGRRGAGAGGRDDDSDHHAAPSQIPRADPVRHSSMQFGAGKRSNDRKPGQRVLAPNFQTLGSAQRFHSQLYLPDLPGSVTQLRSYAPSQAWTFLKSSRRHNGRTSSDDRLYQYLQPNPKRAASPDDRPLVISG